MKPPKMSGLLNFFDCSGVDPVHVQEHLGFGLDARTGLSVDLGFGPSTQLAGRYSHVPVSGDLRREIQIYGDRIRDARWIWSRVVLTPGVDGPSGTNQRGTRVIRDKTGMSYVVTETLEHSQVAGMQGYLLLREQT